MPETTKLTPEQIEAKRLELQKSLNTEIEAIVIEDSKDNQIIGYLKQPVFDVKMKALEKAGESRPLALKMLLDSSLIKEHSDSRITDKNYDNGNVYMSFITACARFLTVYEDTFKKK